MRRRPSSCTSCPGRWTCDLYWHNVSFGSKSLRHELQRFNRPFAVRAEHGNVGCGRLSAVGKVFEARKYPKIREKLIDEISKSLD